MDYGAALEMRFGATRRGFESRPLRQLRAPGERPGVRWLLRSSLTHLQVRSLRSSTPPSPERPAGALPPLRHPRRTPMGALADSGPRTSGQWLRGAQPWTSVGERMLPAEVAGSRWAATPVLEHRANGFAELSFRMGRDDRSALDSPGRARRGTSGALNLQSAPAGLNSHPRSPFSRAAASSDVEDRVPRSGESRTVSGPEGSSTKRSSSGAAERPGPSRSSMWARVSSGRRWVHGNDHFAADRTGAS